MLQSACRRGEINRAPADASVCSLWRRNFLNPAFSHRRIHLSIWFRQEIIALPRIWRRKLMSPSPMRKSRPPEGSGEGADGGGTDYIWDRSPTISIRLSCFGTPVERQWWNHDPPTRKMHKHDQFSTPISYCKLVNLPGIRMGVHE